jgi:hypothetical protein
MKGEVAATGTTMSVNGHNRQVTGKASGCVESVGAAKAGLYYHKKEKRLYASLDVGLAIGLGLEGAF